MCIEAAVVLAGLVLALDGSTEARTFVVNAVEDRRDAQPGDGLCDADAGAAGEQCTLRAAVQEANAAPGADTIELPAGVFVLRLRGSREDGAATGDLDLADDVELVGAGHNVSIIEAQRLKDRGVDVLPGVTASLRGLRVTRGRSPRGESGGCARSRGALTLAATELALCRSRRNGGGLSSQGGTLVLVDVRLFGGKAGRDGGCAYIEGGTATFTNTDVAKCIAGRDGGGLANSAGVVSLSEVRFQSNRATKRGDDIWNERGGVILSQLAFDTQGSD